MRRLSSFAVKVVEFALELAVVVEARGIDGGFGDGAAGFAGVACSRESGSFARFAGCPRKSRRVGLALAHSWTSRSPGMSMRSQPPGMTNIDRVVVVWRPRLSSFADFAGGLAESWPRRRLTRVDLPTPEEPMRAAVSPAAMNRLSWLESVAGGGADGENGYGGGQLERRCRICVQVEVQSVGEVGFIEQDYWARAALLRDDEIALDAALVEVAIEAADDKEGVDVGGEDLFLNVTSRAVCGTGGFCVRRRWSMMAGPGRSETQSPTAGQIR